MDFEKIRISFLSQLIETNDQWKFSYIDFKRLSSLIDRDTAAKFIAILPEKSGFEKSFSELLTNRYFIAFISGLSLSDTKMEINRRKEIALEIIKNSKILIRQCEANKSKDNPDYDFYTDDDLVKWVFLCGIDAVVFLLENTDFKTEVFYGIVNPKKLLVDLSIMIRRVLAITDAAHDNPVQKIYEDTSLVESVAPLMGTLRNQGIDFKCLEPLFEKSKFDIEIDLDLTLSALMAMTNSSDKKLSYRALEIVSYLLGINEPVFATLSKLSPLQQEVNLLLYLLCESLPIESYRENLQKYLLNLLAERDKNYLDTNITLLSIALGLMKRKEYEVKEDVIEFLLFIQNHEELGGAYLAGAFISREYGFESLTNEFKIGISDNELEYFTKQSDSETLEQELSLLYKKPVWFANNVITEYKEISERFNRIFSEEFEKKYSPHFEKIHEDENLNVLEYTVVPLEIALEHYRKNFSGGKLIEVLEKLLSGHPFNFEVGNYLAELYTQSGKGSEAMATLKKCYEKLERVIPNNEHLSGIIIDVDLNSNFHSLKLLASYGINLLDSNNVSGLKVLDKLLSVDPNGRFGVKSRMLEFYIKKKNFTALEDFLEKYRTAETLEFIMANALIKLRRRKKDEAEIEMINALNINRNIIDALLGNITEREIQQEGAFLSLTHRGSKKEARDYAQIYRKYWKQLPGIDSWLNHVKMVFSELI